MRKPIQDCCLLENVKIHFLQFTIVPVVPVVRIDYRDIKRLLVNFAVY